MSPAPFGRTGARRAEHAIVPHGGHMVRDAAYAAPHHEDSTPRPEQSTSSPRERNLILRSGIFAASRRMRPPTELELQIRKRPHPDAGHQDFVLGVGNVVADV